jgi:hypothetical protein
MSAGVSTLLGRCCKSTVALPLDTLSFDVRALSRNDAGGKAAQWRGREARLRVVTVRSATRRLQSCGLQRRVSANAGQAPSAQAPLG